MPTHFEHIMKYLGSKKEWSRKKIGLLVDGPNMFRKEFQMDLEEIKDMLKDYGGFRKTYRSKLLYTIKTIFYFR